MSFVTIWGTTRIKENNMFLFQLNSQTISHHNPLFKIIHSIKVFNLSLLSVCCSVIFLYHTLIHAPSQSWKNTETHVEEKPNTEKYKNTKHAVPVLHGALLLLHGPDLGWVWQRCPQHRRGEALRHRHDAPWLWVTSQFSHVSCFGWAPLTFWRSPLMWSTTPPPAASPIWLSLSLFVVVKTNCTPLNISH